MYVYIYIYIYYSTHISLVARSSEADQGSLTQISVKQTSKHTRTNHRNYQINRQVPNPKDNSSIRKGLST